VRNTACMESLKYACFVDVITFDDGGDEHDLSEKCE